MERVARTELFSVRCEERVERVETWVWRSGGKGVKLGRDLGGGERDLFGAFGILRRGFAGFVGWRGWSL